MWECPDLFVLEGQDVLIVSPMEMQGKGPEFIDGNTAMCLFGQRSADGRFLPESAQAVDYGLDFYATHTIAAPDGRRILIAWMQYWGGIIDHPRKDLPFFGQMTLPRELKIKAGRLVQNPVRELEHYRREKVLYQDISVCGEKVFPEIHGRTIDLTVKVKPDGTECYKRFTVTLAADKENGTEVCYIPETDTITVDRSRSGWSSEVLNQRTFAVRDCGGEITLRFILDRYSIELFVNDGEQAASFVIFSPQEADRIIFKAEGAAVMTVEQYTLKIGDNS
jgi:beta-fructofuranosidase